MKEVINHNIKMKGSINSLKNENEQLRFFKPYNGIYYVLSYEGKKFGGIMNFLTEKAEGSKNEVIDITTNSPSNKSGHEPKNLINYKDENSYFHSLAVEDVHVCFDFKDKSIQLNAYQIKTLKSKESYHLKNWKIEGSNDGQNWETIDEHTNDNILNESNKIVTFDKLTSKSDSFYRFIRLLQTGLNCKGDYYVIFHNIEFYGVLNVPLT